MTKTTDELAPWDKLGIQAANIADIPQLLDLAWGMEKKITFCFIGDTGIGKTPSIKQWADSKGLFMRTLHFGQMRPNQIALAMFNEAGTSYDFVPGQWFLELNERAEKDGGAVLNIDEWNRGNKDLVNMMFGLNDERMLHGRLLHPNVLIVAAMNPSEGGYHVNEAERDPAVRKRLNLVYVRHDFVTWCQHMRKTCKHPGVLEDVIDFLQAQPAFYYDAAARDAGKSFACPANWEKVINLIASATALYGSRNAAYKAPLVATGVAGQIGSTAGQKFLEFAADRSVVIEPKDVLYHYNDPKHPIRARVLRLLNAYEDADGVLHRPTTGGVRVDVITNLNEALMRLWLQDKPSQDGPSPACLARYLLDLGDELYCSFLDGAFTNALQSNSDNDPYWMSQYNRAMRIAYPEYQLMANRDARQQQILSGKAKNPHHQRERNRAKQEAARAAATAAAEVLAAGSRSAAAE